jgi:hypothetical protein
MYGCCGGPGFGPQYGFGRRFGMGHWAGPRRFTREEEIDMWEEYQKDLEEELAEVTSRVERLKSRQKEGTASAAA